MINESSRMPVVTRFRKGIRQAVFIIVLGMAIALCFNALHTRGLPLAGDWSESAVMEQHSAGISTVTPDEAFTAYLDGTAVFLDTRAEADFASGTLPDAINVPPERAALHLTKLRELKAAGRSIIAYCDGPDCPLSAELARLLQTEGLNIAIMPQGISGWVETGYPLADEVSP